ncbi:PfkB family carbohydrate kinase [Kamptonema cortianum]|nr:PfkB family carbohydrate kinase [Oscillatoria laete-virens]MDK3158011.1 PfkB family carbohydrate kinase [Kamptonema cortianum]MDL5053112.1 PfkB family carbohydrate kinase [Oscillatoria laete-virens NRMC-F 0139]
MNIINVNPKQVIRQTAEALVSSKSKIRRVPGVVGFDGFVDHIIHVVDKRKSATDYQPIKKIKDFAKRVNDAAGKSANMEMVTVQTRLGGNGPIMANALVSFSMPVTYIGLLGSTPDLHPMFREFAKRAKVISIADPSETDALEFEDGKLMMGKHGTLHQLTWANILKKIPANQLVKAFSDAKFIAMVNWTMLPHMGDIWKQLLKDVGPAMKGEKRVMFFDLADPAKRTADDLKGALAQITKFQQYFNVVLGLNEKESEQVAEVLGVKASGKKQALIVDRAIKIREKLGIHVCVIHPVQFAAAASEADALYVDGPFTAKPKTTTGAGDNFNAGFSLGFVNGFGLARSLQLGVATSGFYVRNAKSPTVDELIKFLQTL